MRESRNAAILEAAIELAKVEGYQWITRDMVAKAAGVSTGSVHNAFGNFVELKREVMRQAIARQIVPIVAQGLAEGSLIAQSAPPALRQQVAASLA